MLAEISCRVVATCHDPELSRDSLRIEDCIHIIHIIWIQGQD
jgi:hypothetical protein